MEETKIVFLADGRKVVLEDEDNILLSLVANDEVESTFQVSYPSAGYGGGSLLLSPSEHYLVFSYFSGESEEAFMLFKIDNKGLKFLYDSGYLYGEDANYCFVNKEKILIQTFRTGSWYEEDAEVDENGDKYYEFGIINIFNVETQELNTHNIRVYPSDDWEEEETDAGSFLFSEIINGNSFSVIMPWGKEIFHYPLQDIVAIRFK